MTDLAHELLNHLYCDPMPADQLMIERNLTREVKLVRSEVARGLAELERLGRARVEGGVWHWQPEPGPAENQASLF